MVRGNRGKKTGATTTACAARFLPLHMRESPPPIPRIPRQRPHPRAPFHAKPVGPDENDRHLHRIAVETGPQPVFVTIGRTPEDGTAIGDGPSTAAGGSSSHTPIPGGFAKLFNRVIDYGAWAELPDAARTVYVPMARFAEGRDGFRVRIGLAALMKYTRLSRSSIKRALRALLEARLIALVRAGGVAPDGTNRTNVYQLLLPEPEAAEDAISYETCSPGTTTASGGRAAALASPIAAREPSPEAIGGNGSRRRSPQSAARAKRGRNATAEGSAVDGSLTDGTRAAPVPPFSPHSGPRPQIAFSISSWHDSSPYPTLSGPPAHGAGSMANPLPVPSRSPAPSSLEPPPRSAAVPGGGRGANPAGGPPAPGTGTAGGPLHRANNKYAISETVDDDSLGHESMMPESEPVLSEQQASLRRLLETWGIDPQVALDVVQTYCHEQIVRAVSAARQAKSRGGLVNPAGYIVRCLDGLPASTGLARQGSAAGTASVASCQSERRGEERGALAARAVADARIDDLDDQTLGCLAERVLAMHAQRPTMLRLLSARPPRESRLMRAEIAALLEG